MLGWVSFEQVVVKAFVVAFKGTLAKVYLFVSESHQKVLCMPCLFFFTCKVCHRRFFRLNVGLNATQARHALRSLLATLPSSPPKALPTRPVELEIARVHMQQSIDAYHFFFQLLSCLPLFLSSCACLVSFWIGHCHFVLQLSCGILFFF